MLLGYCVGGRDGHDVAGVSRGGDTSAMAGKSPAFGREVTFLNYKRDAVNSFIGDIYNHLGLRGIFDGVVVVPENKDCLVASFVGVDTGFVGIDERVGDSVRNVPAREPDD